MLKRIKCLFKGHKYMMGYIIDYRSHYPSSNDRCQCCQKTRKNLII